MNDFTRRFKNKLEDGSLRITVVGLGYVGLPLAVEFAGRGFRVTGIDLDKDRISRLKRKVSYINDVETSDIKRLTASGKLGAENDFHSLKEADAIIICVPTPLKSNSSPDISFIKNAVCSISRHMKAGVLIVLESTTYPGTTEEIILPILENGGRKHGRDFFLCFSPERIDPGNKEYPLRKIPKVIGGISKEAGGLASALYQKIINKVIIVSSTRVAETVKLLENTFRLINIGLIDEIAMMAHKMDMDIWEIINAAKTKPFGFMPFYPGPGVGGHCIPKDPLYLYWKARHHGFKSRFIKLASDVISAMPGYIIGRMESILRENGKVIEGARILVVGVTYKKDIKDLRKSPALDIIEGFQEKKARVSYYDPLIPYLTLGKIKLRSIGFSAGALKKFDCCVIATDHTAINYKLLLANSSVIFDARNVYKNLENRKVVKL